jgi:tartrate-resistant acid phosphatase type 5
MHSPGKKYLLITILLLLVIALFVQIADPTLSASYLGKAEIFLQHQIRRYGPPVQTHPVSIVAVQTEFPESKPHVYSQLSANFAVIGDYGLAGRPESDVANLVLNWKPDFIISVGDNNYTSGAAASIDENIGQYYHSYIYPYSGAYGFGAATNKFFPVLGNHDWKSENGQPYLNYFNLPGNGRYYDFVQGPVHFFMLDSDSHEPDGITSTSIQALWLKNALSLSTSPWNIVVLHHAPYSSGEHGSSTALQWPFQAWGADAVLAGHDHTYERLAVDNIPYFVDGIGGSSIYNFGAPVPQSRVRYNADFGAMLVKATDTTILFEFYNRSGALIDSFTLSG